MGDVFLDQARPGGGYMNFSKLAINRFAFIVNPLLWKRLLIVLFEHLL